MTIDMGFYGDGYTGYSINNNEDVEKYPHAARLCTNRQDDSFGNMIDSPPDTDDSALEFKDENLH